MNGPINIWRQKHMSNIITEEIKLNYIEYYKDHKLQKNHVLYEAYGGRGLVCNPYGLFKAFIKRQDFRKYQHFWVIEDFEANDSFIREYQSMNNVHFVRYQSEDYVKHLATAGYLINNVSFPPYFTPRKKQIYINCWHGIPWRKIGFDMENGNVDTRNTIRNFLAADYIITPNDFMTSIFRKTFKLEGIYPGKLIPVNQPRTDLLFSTKKETMIQKLHNYGIKLEEHKNLILYVPTCRERENQCPDIHHIEEYLKLLEILEQQLNTEQYQVLMKPHQILYEYLKKNKLGSKKIIPAEIDTNEMLAITDILISDYSSIYYDFLETEKPVLFYIPDGDQYKKDRESYHSAVEMPGPTFKSADKLTQCILEEQWKHPVYQTVYQKQKQWTNPWQNKHSGEKVWEIVLDGRHRNSLISLKNKKKKILIYGSDLRGNGVTQSLLSLLEQMNYEKYDVSVLAVLNAKNTNGDMIESVDSRARVLTQIGKINGIKEEMSIYDTIIEKGLSSFDAVKNYPKSLFRREFQRMFGWTKFDCVIEFTGYSPHYGMLFLASGAKRKMIWQHNDLGSERKRAVHGNQSLEQILNVVFSTYSFYDKIVSCSQSVMELNKKTLSNIWTRKKFTYARNTFSINRIYNAIEKNPFLEIGQKDYYILQEQQNENDNQIEMQLLPLPEKDHKVFITMGRLSPEKNHHNLILAFHRLQKEYPKTILFILGDGPLKENLQNEIRKLHLENQVFLTGNIRNPFALIQKADCFILTSNYEGQPMSVLEVRVLKIPVIISDFTTRKDICIPNGQLIVQKDPDSIFQGMKKMCQGTVCNYNFSPEEYNQSAYLEFEALLK